MDRPTVFESVAPVIPARDLDGALNATNGLTATRPLTATDLRDRYRDMAKTLGFEGHMAWAEAMP